MGARSLAIDLADIDLLIDWLLSSSGWNICVVGAGLVIILMDWGFGLGKIFWLADVVKI